MVTISDSSWITFERRILAISWWMWFGSIIAFSYCVFDLWRATSRGEITGGIGVYTRSGSPVFFWIKVFFTSVMGAASGLAMLGALFKSGF
jgi:hypothetical protein